MKIKFPSLKFLTICLDAGINNTVDILMYKLLLLEKKIEQDIVVDFVATQKRINKICKKYSLCKVTVKRSLKRLAASGLIKIIYDVSFGKMVVHVVPFPGLIDPDYNPQTDVSQESKTQSADGMGKTPEKPESKGIDQQQLIYADQLCRSAGMVFHRKNLWEIAKYPKDLISRSIDYYKFVRERTHIPSPTGWLICCLRDKYYLNFKPEKFVSSAEQKFFELQEWFLENFGSLPTRAKAAFSGGIPIPSQ